MDEIEVIAVVDGGFWAGARVALLLVMPVWAAVIAAGWWLL